MGAYSQHESIFSRDKLILFSGQLLHLPDVCSSATTKEQEVVSNLPTTTSTGSRENVPVNEIAVRVKHEFQFKAPLPKGGRTLEMNTTLLIYSSEQERKIVRLQDRPLENIPDNSFITVSCLAALSWLGSC